MQYSDRFLNYYMAVAEETAKMSYAKRLQVGSVIVVDNGIVSTGFNGTPKNEDNCCEHEVDGKIVTKPSVIHAEQNAINRVTERNLSSQGGSIFITHCPCIPCALSIINAGIHSVFYRQDYRDKTGLTLLDSHGIDIQKI
jgi:dCMP deaminase